MAEGCLLQVEKGIYEFVDFNPEHQHEDIFCSIGLPISIVSAPLLKTLFVKTQCIFSLSPS